VSDGPRKVRFEVAAADAGKRLDQVLAANVPGLSRTRARLLLELGGVFVDRARVKIASRPVQAGQVIEANLGGALDRATPALGRDARARDDAALPPYTIVHEDDDLVVVDKPAGLLTAPTPESDRGNLADLLGRRGRGPVQVVHRLDLPTSGLLVFARSDAAGRALAERFRTHDVDRVYLGVVAGRLDAERTVDAPISDRPARTLLAPVEALAGATLVRATLDTGRQHQIRIHAASIGHPVLGDRRHGAPTDHDPPRLALHAARLGFIHPASGAPLLFESPWPADLAAWLDQLRQGAIEVST
jgi:23S rRNA pseudouridine1911/1915/1917 synthase